MKQVVVLCLVCYRGSEELVGNGRTKGVLVSRG